MKTFAMLPIVAMVVSGWIPSFGQGIEPEVPGDHFSLEGALELFKKSASPEEFERLLNSADSKVNNLDLNGDGYIDYIKVLDRNDGNVHAFILQAVISETENQDVAVIELEKLANGKAVLQIIGDEDVYGIETIIEPTREVRTYAGTTSAATVVNVWAWPSVQYIYGPRYAGWISPWGWYHRPVWYHTWRPIAYVHYYPIWRPYYDHYAICHTYRVAYAHRIYRPYRTTSVVVYNRHHTKLAHYRSTREDDHRNGRVRDDDRRSYASNNRSSNSNAPQRGRADSDFNRRSSTQAEVTSPRRSTTIKRNGPANIQRNSPGVKRDDSQDRRPVTVPDERGVRPQVVNRSRTSVTPDLQQRPTTSERSLPTNVQRNATELKRDDTQNRRPIAVPDKRDVRQPVTNPYTNRTKPSGNADVQPRPTTRERSVPASIQRNSPAPRREVAPSRSDAVQNNRSTRQPVPSPSINRSRSTGSPAVQQRPSHRSGGATRSGENRRGRD